MKTDDREIQCKNTLDSSRKETVVDSCVHGAEPLCSIKG
jgi:hypothetical protein